MSAIARIGQDFGIFQEDAEKIFLAASKIPTRPRTVVDKYTILDGELDPAFPYQGRIKQVFYCFSQSETMAPFLVSVALKGLAKNWEVKNEVAIYNRFADDIGIAKPLLVKEVGEFQYIILELFNQGALTEFLLENHEALEPWQRDWIFYSVASAVQKCHDRGIVLRDLKTDNILVRTLADGSIEAKLTDFGMALYLPTATETEKRRPCGTPDWLPPEVYLNKFQRKPFSPANFSADLWALGLVFYTEHLLEACIGDLEANRGLRGIALPEFPQFNSIHFGPFTEEIRELLSMTPEARPPVAWIVKRVSDIYRRVYQGFPIPYKIPDPKPLTFEQILDVCGRVKTKSGERILDKIRSYL